MKHWANSEFLFVLQSIATQLWYTKIFWIHDENIFSYTLFFCFENLRSLDATSANSGVFFCEHSCGFANARHILVIPQIHSYIDSKESFIANETGERKREPDEVAEYKGNAEKVSDRSARFLLRLFPVCQWDFFGHIRM